MWTAWLVRGRNDKPSSRLADKVVAVAMIEYLLQLFSDSKKIKNPVT